MRVARNTGVGAFYHGGVNPDSFANVRLGVEGDAFYSSYRGGCTVMWAVCSVSDMDAGTPAPVGGPHGLLPSGSHGDGEGLPSWLCGRRGV